MSNCIKDLYDYDLVEKCYKCGIVKLNSNFHKNKKMSDGLYKQCRLCVNQKQKQYDVQNRAEIKNYPSDNKDKRNEYFRKRKVSDPNFKIACNLK